MELWIHDSNASVNVELKRRGITSDNDLWHGIKNFKKMVKPVTEGAKKNKGVTWHERLEY